MTKPDMTAKAIETRLDALAGLYALGVSLANVGASIPKRVFDNRSLFILGRASVAALNKLGLPIAADRNVPVLVDRGGKVHRVGDEFDLLADPEGTRIVSTTRCILVGVNEQLGKARNDIPLGCRTLATLRFVDGVPAEIAALAAHDCWEANAAYRLVKAADWKRRPA
jgi:hypothetical protein